MGLASGVKAGAAFAVLASALLATILYLNTLGHGFVFDDLDVITANPFVTGRDRGLSDIFTSHYWAHRMPAGDLYRPLVILSYRLNHVAGGLDPAGYHAVNIALHALVSALVAALGLRLGWNPGGALAAGALFAAHPIHTEAVAGVVGRAELMAAAGVLAAWLVHLSGRRATLTRVGAVCALLAAALLSKENAVVLPALLAGGDMWRARRGGVNWRDVSLTHIAVLLTAAAWMVARAALLDPVPAGSIAESPFAGVPANLRILTALSIIARYLWLLVVPLRLSADYSFDEIPLVTSPADPLALAGAAGLMALAALAAWGLLRAHPPWPASLAALVLLAALSPVSNLLVPIGTVMGERLLYLPSVGFCLALGPLVARLGRPGAAVLLVVAALYGARTVDRNADWEDQLTLFTVTAETSPRSSKVRYNLGAALRDAGRPAEALAAYEAALAIRPDDARSHHNAGLLLLEADRPHEAAGHLREAARLDPEIPDVFSTLAAACSRLGLNDEAEGALRRAIERDPASHGAQYNMGTLMLSLGRIADSIEPLERARDLDPADADGRYQLGVAYRLAGRPGDALAEFRAALQLPPPIPETHIQLALALLQTGDRGGAAAHALEARRAGLTLPAELLPLAP